MSDEERQSISPFGGFRKRLPGLKAIDDEGKRRLVEILVERIDIDPENRLKVDMVFSLDAQSLDEAGRRPALENCDITTLRRS